tara:strand:- start:3369 stop:4046 length:678 start_codon:yes stop_codon:yes gene_type:complete
MQSTQPGSVHPRCPLSLQSAKRMTRQANDNWIFHGEFYYMSDELTHIKDLVPDPKNRRKHTPRNVGMIVDALHKVGAARSIVIDENNEVMAGNATVEAAGEAGITKLKIVDAAGDELVAVRRTGLTTDQKRNLAIYDNRTGELAEWDVDQLLKDVETGIDLSSFFSEKELGYVLDNAENVSKVIADGVSEGLEYRVIVECLNESHQVELLERFKKEGIKCQALIS